MWYEEKKKKPVILILVYFFMILVPIKSSLLSPINSILSTYPPCGSCNADNAACISVAGKRTCWCRAGYFKNGDKCGK